MTARSHQDADDEAPMPRSGVVDGLIASGEIAVLGTGSVGLSGRPLALLRACDATFQSWAAERGATEWRVPALIPGAVLERAEFFDAFPHLATRVEPAGGPAHDHGDEHFLSTAVCYHLYPLLASQSVGDGVTLTAAAECYRSEAEMRPLERQWAFTMREIVFVGPAAGVDELLTTLTERTMSFARELGLAASLAPATDPFFAPAGRGKALIQQLKGLKCELVADGEDGAPLAIASFNKHESFFGRAFDIRLDDGSPAHSACVAFGLERWVAALISRHGPDVRL